MTRDEEAESAQDGKRAGEESGLDDSGFHDDVFDGLKFQMREKRPAVSTLPTYRKNQAAGEPGNRSAMRERGTAPNLFPENFINIFGNRIPLRFLFTFDEIFLT